MSTLFSTAFSAIPSRKRAQNKAVPYKFRAYSDGVVHEQLGSGTLGFFIAIPSIQLKPGSSQTSLNGEKGMAANL